MTSQEYWAIKERDRKQALADIQAMLGDDYQWIQSILQGGYPKSGTSLHGFSVAERVTAYRQSLPTS